ncbi:hypothetical protein K504DRAFT_466561 [Pleomassaria siparia CBS 279.74]|uniref:Uncharacterized protein n=1 Tax=Pleomassaria siparia CBS 279.74 TaxID=1314801 RepID=A0A6G1KC74_9PLEO|nr:hypothetical protein K504DRAFT_466561 [Pleomassaria siparia CBS 279.74]
MYSSASMTAPAKTSTPTPDGGPTSILGSRLCLVLLALQLQICRFYLSGTEVRD